MFGKNEPAPQQAKQPPARTPIMAGNWKMNETNDEAVTLSQAISFQSYKDWKECEVILCPPFIDLKSVSNVIYFDKAPMKLGAQDVFWEEEGAYTGAISPKMLAQVGCDYCIVGHSERRQYFGETDETVNRKVKALIAHGITPIMCCGENLATRDAGETLEFIGSQVRLGLEGVEAADVARLVVAYEPIWAIGTGRAATPEQAEEACAHIRSVVGEVAGGEAAEKVRILYGGSMKPANAELFLPQPDIDGGLIGGASLDAKAFASLVTSLLKIKVLP